MEHPLPIVVSVRQTRVHAQTPAALLWRAHRHLHHYRVVLGESQRRGQRQLLDHIAADLVTRPDRQFHEHAARHHDRARHHVIGQPRLRTHRQPAGQHHSIGIGQAHGRPQQRVPCRGQTQNTGITALPGGVRPEPLVLEGVGRQIDPATASQHGPPVHGYTAHEQLSGRDQDPVQPTLVAAQRPGDHRICCGLVHAFADADCQHRVRAHLHERPVPLLQQLPDRRGEADRVAQVVTPVRRVEFRPFQPLAGHGRQHRHPHRTPCHLRQDLGQFRTDQINLSRMRGIVHRDPTNPHPVLGQTLDQLLDGLHLTGHHHRARAVDRRDRHPSVPDGQPLAYLLDRQRHRGHRAEPGQPVGNQAAAQGHDSCAVLQGQGTRDHRSGDLALRVADHGVGADS
ncbi:hypothetical protein Aple_058450 [Acrocarpospora pleiomorpha]|uniref:Uncharacterized protein n=1 Tax=Acrocarpospora pleiomorpha TaxID=90975 RepID=A0A5M3XQB6_9ACTN|nr:hypothetical protein Aple_058450 [Acrocarpospora pleiomorpha]